jgi:glucokinase
MQAYMGLDIGGTKILGALYNLDGELIKRFKKKTKAAEGIDTVLSQIFKVIDALIEEEDIELLGIGAGSPGIIKEDGIIAFSPNIPFKDFDLGEKIRTRYKTPFVLGNDVNVAMFGEWKVAEHKESRNVLGLFIGTGVGGAIIIDGKLYTGQGGAAEFGHMVVSPEGANCGCGSQGCLEAYASKTGIQNALKGQIKKGRVSLIEGHMKSDGAILKSSSIKSAFEQQDALVTEVIKRAIYYLGIAVGNLVNMYHPDLIILGGGMMEAMGGEMLGDIVEEAMRHSMPGMLNDVAFELSHLSDDAGIYGAYALIRDRVEGGQK